MIGLAVAAYAVVALLFVRPLAGHFAWAYLASQKATYSYLYARQEKPGGEAWFVGYLGAVGCVAVWPLVAVVLLGGLMGPTIGAEREAALRAREKHIAEMERELGLVDG